MYTLAIVIEKRQPLKDGTFPVKLRVTIDRKARYFSLDYHLTEKEFQSVFSPTAKGRNKTLRDKLLTRQEKAQTILENMEAPNLDDFRALFTQKAVNKGGTVKKYFDQYIAELTAENRHGTASNYRCSMNCLADFANIETLSFKQVTADFLKRYAAKMEADGKTPSTMGIYLRPLRHLFKKAQNNNEAPKEYPFGSGTKQFAIPSSEKHKRPLERHEIEKLAGYKSSDPQRIKYRDFFLLSYLLCGLNFADLLTIRWRQIDGDTLIIRREKTKRTTKSGATIQLFISPQARAIIDLYATPGTFVFDVVNEADNSAAVHRKIQNFTSNTNQSLKRIATAIGINPKISTVYARHSAASHGIEAGATVADISAALGHSDIKTTSNYISGLQSGRQKLGESLGLNLQPQQMEVSTN
jgi:integrase/recombinase XerD